MTDNIEWGEWVPFSSVGLLLSRKDSLYEIRYDLNSKPIAYRIGTVKPVVTMQALYWQNHCAATLARHHDTHRITITLHDGKPVGIAIEELK